MATHNMYRLKSGKFQVHGKTYQKGAVLPEYDIPKAFLNDFELLTPQAAVAATEEDFQVVDDVKTKPLFALNPRGGGWFDIVNTATGRTMNESAMREDAANTELAKMLANG